MSSLSPIGPRQYQTLSNASPKAEAKGTRAQNGVAETNSNAVVPGKGIDLDKRVDKLGNATLDMAQDFFSKFAKDIFGDALKGATVSYDSVSLEVNSSFAAGIQHSEGPDGVSDAAAFSLNENSHFIGKGTITTADGRKFDFEIEVQYEAKMEASAGRSSSVPARRQDSADQNPAMPLPTIEFPDIDFPGSLADLFKLMEKPLKADVSAEGKPEDKLGTLSLRLLDLVKNKEVLDTYSPPTKPPQRGSVKPEPIVSGPALPVTDAAPEKAPASTAAPAVADTSGKRASDASQDVKSPQVLN
ncbi:hypothetical protein [Massilia sp. NR 4-1]|uniref:hypothetical protein n=1 Tax=Massilia sp. NR 4-1 TaxID=1678028 RepID=UPI00067D4A7C|nr:hypothetical protein [Massilia sp. NR 4-1]AKU20404.1 hypothetical protein ACZ75_01550 [Massilia sp. NR 4-1]